ncbi:MAG: BlaI/MecI/CopY family transcriptional regulator [Verrucomicrobia bacterium]|nr:BlaI/MecI/CopY family transcriptional regulator [Verrucomicrobiota bacterium]
MAKKPPKLGDVQLELMKVVWAKGKATVREVTDAIAAKREMAYTTVLTMLRDLETKGLLSHEVDGRTYVYKPVVQRKRIVRGIVGDITRRLFDGSPAALLAHVLDAETIEPDELDRMKRMIAEKERERPEEGRSSKAERRSRNHE